MRAFLAWNPRKRRAAVALGAFAGVFAAYYLGLVALGELFRPDLPTERVTFPEEAVAEAAALRDTDLAEDRPTLPQAVDYAAGPEASWRPRGEPPLLESLVAEGALPPVGDRIGSEPLVLKGPDGIGNHGGTAYMLDASTRVGEAINTRFSGATLVRWSPQGYPIVPHIAKSWTVSDEGRVYTFELRKGMRWSDGQPFDADDILYWWTHEENHPDMPKERDAHRRVMLHNGKVGSFEKIDDDTVRFSFPDPNLIFLEKLAGSGGAAVVGSPAHYLKPYHPFEGDREAMERAMDALQLPSARSVYTEIKQWYNPAHPRLWPWIYRAYKASPPQTFVRNPYYFAVDPEGNQLPYLDRLMFDKREERMLAIATASGEPSVQPLGLTHEEYTLLMENRERNGYRLLHWHAGSRTPFIIYVNMNKIVEPGDEDGQRQLDLLRDKRFRQALSLAIDRPTIIQLAYSGMGKAMQFSPLSSSPFHSPELSYAFVEQDLDEANRLLDEIGLVERDREGFRLLPNGSRMQFFLNTTSARSPYLLQLVAESWAEAGVRVIPRVKSGRLYGIEKRARLHDFSADSTDAMVNPLLAAAEFAPVYPIYYARAWGAWFQQRGHHGEPTGPGAIEPPKSHPVRDAVAHYERTLLATTLEEQVARFKEVELIVAENLWHINVTTAPPDLVMVKDGFRNVPELAFSAWSLLTPANVGPELFFWDEPSDSPGAIEQMRHDLLHPTLMARLSGFGGSGAAAAEPHAIGTWIRWMIVAIFLAALLLLALRHPFVGRRLLIMVPTLAVISVIAFTIIQIPPGNFITSYIIQLEESGQEADLQEIKDLEELFELDKSAVHRYFTWTGLRWFLTFKESDRGLLQGDLGRSMDQMIPVNELVGDRILLTFLISFATILFTWVLALPIGIFSAVRQYSIMDYAATFLGFVGMSIPNFLLAIVLMYISAEWFGVNVSGLFSAEYATQPEWSFGKFLDLLQHIWLPVVVLGLGGTAGMIRVMRGNLLDELKKPYVVTARAKGVKPGRLILKYPVRLALNPFISGIGSIFPQLVSGGAIVAVVLSLPTVGPLLLQALLTEDMYLAGSMLMVLSLLGVLGTLVSDLLLLALDPRIRMEGGTR